MGRVNEGTKVTQTRAEACGQDQDTEQYGGQCATESGAQTSESGQVGSGETRSELRPKVEESTCPGAQGGVIINSPLHSLKGPSGTINHVVAFVIRIKRAPVGKI